MSFDRFRSVVKSKLRCYSKDKSKDNSKKQSKSDRSSLTLNLDVDLREKLINGEYNDGELIEDWELEERILVGNGEIFNFTQSVKIDKPNNSPNKCVLDNQYNSEYNNPNSENSDSEYNNSDTENSDSEYGTPFSSEFYYSEDRLIYTPIPQKIVNPDYELKNELRLLNKLNNDIEKILS